MTENTRRGFLKNLGLAVSVPLLPSFVFNEQGSARSLKTNSHHVLACNIRVALEEDDQAGVGWNDRKDICIEVIRKYQPDIIGFQEVLRVQNEDLKEAFPGFFSFGFEGPEMDAHTEGYHGIAKNPIFFSKERYGLLSAGSYWLSETPHIGGSKSWGTARARHVNWVRLMDKKTSLDFRVVNLHLDHVSQEAREKQIQMVLEEGQQYPAAYPQILTGDFNASQENNVVKMIKEAGWMDSYAQVHGDSEPGYTVHSFQGENHPRKDQRKKIDFIFTKGNWETNAAKIIKDHKNGRYPSDHYFVSAALVTKK